MVPGLSDLDAKQSQFDALIAKLQIKSASVSNVSKTSSGKGSFWEGEEISELLSNAGVRCETFLAKNKLQFIRRKINGGEYYFISNDGKTAFNDWAQLDTKMKYAVLFDPMQQRSGVAKTKQGENNALSIFLQLAPGESCIIQTAAAKFTGPQFAYAELIGKTIAINRAWDLKFISGGPALPGPVKIEQLQSWTNLSVDGVKEFSGTATYSTRFKKPTSIANAWLLDLGDVRESATVVLNGKTIATLIGPTYSVTIPSTHLKADNILEVIVTNGMANRVIDLDKKRVQWKKFYNINMSAKLAENRGTDGLFTTAKWEPKASGLIGPVTLQQVKILK